MNKPKLTIITPGAPSKNGKGYQVILHHRLKYLADVFDIVIYQPRLFYRGVDNSSHADVNYETFRVGLLDIIINCFRSFRTRAPIQTIFGTSVDLMRRLRADDSSIVLCMMSRLALNLGGVSKDRIVIDFVDSMHLNFSRRAKNSRGLLRAVYRWEASLCQTFEKRLAEEVRLSFAVSKIDAELIGSGVKVLPLGVECSNRQSARKLDICFTGNMKYAPNVEAVKWFYLKVWRRYRLELAGFRLKVVGRDPSSDLMELFKSDPTAELVGYVEDMEAEISSAFASVAPMMSGSGMQFKILEAMAAGTPVIATDLAVGDIKATSGNNILIANTPKEFVREILDLADNSQKWVTLSDNAREFVRLNHEWESINVNLLKAIKSSVMQVNSGV